MPDFKPLLETIYGSDTAPGYMLAVFSLSLLLTNITKVRGHFYSIYNECCLYFAEISLIVYFSYLLYRDTILLYIAVLGLAGSVILFGGNWLYVRVSLARTAQNRDDLKRWEGVDNFHSWGMTYAQHYLHEWYKASSLVVLGSMTKSDGIIKELENNTGKRFSDNSNEHRFYKARFAYYRGIRAFLCEDTAEAISQFQKMDTFSEKNRVIQWLFEGVDENFYRINALINLGASYTKRGNYYEACEHLERAVREISGKKQYASVLNVLYHNYIISALQVEPDAVNIVLQEYQKAIGDKDIKAEMLWFNEKMSVMHQTSTDYEGIERELQGFFLKMMKELENEKHVKQRCAFIADMSRIVFANHFDPQNVLLAIKENLKYFDDLPMPLKFRAYSGIDYMFMNLSEVPQTVKYQSEKDKARLYMASQAENDLKDYYDSLPIVAVYSKMECYGSLASLHSANQMMRNADLINKELNDVVKKSTEIKETGINSFETHLQVRRNIKKSKKKKSRPGFINDRYELGKTLSYMNAEVDIAEREDLTYAAYHIRLNMIDEICAIVNLDSNGYPISIDKMKSFMTIIEDEYIPKIQNDHIVLAEFAIRLSVRRHIVGGVNSTLL